MPSSSATAAAAASIQYRTLDGYKYETRRDYVIHLENVRPSGLFPIDTPYLKISLSGVLWIKAGYCWDGPSGPAIDTKNFMRASLVHDALYQLIRMGLLSVEMRGEADRILRKLCLEDGMSTARAWWVYTAVKSFARRACDPDPDHDTVHLLEAP